MCESLKLTLGHYPAIHTNYIVSNCTILNYKDLNQFSVLVVINTAAMNLNLSIFSTKKSYFMFVTAVVICDYLEVNIFMTQNNMLPAYTKVNQAKLIFIFTSRLSPVLIVGCTWLT